MGRRRSRRSGSAGTATGGNSAFSKRNLTTLSRALDRFWDAGRPVAAGGQASRRPKRASARSSTAGRDPKTIRTWAVANGIEVPTRGRIPAMVERQYDEANRTA